MYMYREVSVGGGVGAGGLPREAQKLCSGVHQAYLFVVHTNSQASKGGLALNLCECSNVYIQMKQKFPLAKYSLAT